MDWRNLVKQSVTVGAQLLWGGRYGCNNGRYGCTIVMSYIEINKAVSQWLLTFNLCVSVTWPLTCAFHIPCTHTPEIIDMHRGMCDNGKEIESGDHFTWELQHMIIISNICLQKCSSLKFVIVIICCLIEITICKYGPILWENRTSASEGVLFSSRIGMN